MQETIKFIKAELAPFYHETEVGSMVRLILEHTCNITYMDISLQKNLKVDKQQMATINNMVERLKKHEPIQYVLGETEFYSLPFKVTPDVLIPRPETEELVDWILHSNIDKKADILDIGTGSGCIPVVLKHHFPLSKVSAIDISGAALALAKENAAANKTEVSFKKRDILKWQEYPWGEYGLIVSNPPYIRKMEKKFMQENVLGYEPPLALFVEDGAPLVFYSGIADFAKSHLKKGGLLFFEINEAFGEKVKNMLLGKGFSSVELKKDLSGKDRMIKANN